MRCCIEWREIVTVCIVLTGLASLSSCSRITSKPPPAALTIYFTCDTNGRLEPCGCFTGQHGGLTRLKTYLDGEGYQNALLADVGNAIDGNADYQIIKYGYIQQAYAEMHYTALNMGQREARLSAAELKKLRDASPVPMISANILDSATGRPIFSPYRVVNYGGYRVGLVGVVEPPGGDQDVGEGLAVEPMSTAIAKVLPELRGKCDIMVLLAFADEAGMSALAREFYEFDVIFGGNVRQPSQKLITENRSIILFTTNESKTLGVLNAELAGPSKLIAKSYNIVFLEQGIPQDVSLLARVRDYRAEIRKTRLDVDSMEGAKENEVPGVQPDTSYVGSETCAQCHAGAYNIWKNTAHARAFDSLVAKGADADPSCIGCHTVGFGSPSGYRREYGGKSLINVGCETCHGPGSEHVRQRRAGGKALFTYRPLASADCENCHYGEFSRRFDWNSFWPYIKHGKEGVALSRNTTTGNSP